MILLVLLGLWAVLRTAPETPIGRWLQMMCVERPAEQLGRIGAGHILLIVVTIAIGAMLVWLLEGDGAQVAAAAVPDAAMWVSTFEVVTWLDALAGITTIAASTRWNAIKAVILPVRRAPRTRRRRRARKAASPPANDNDRPAYAAATRRA